MKQLRNTTRVLATIVAVMIVLSSVQGIARAQSNLNPIVVLYDASHEQQYAADSEDLGLKSMLDMVNASTKYLVRVNEDQELTASLLNDVDILIIAAPDDQAPFTQAEFDGIGEMLANGSSLFVLGDPTIDDRTSYWSEALMQDLGENEVINSFLDGINITSVRFSLNETGVASVFGDTMFDYSHPVFNASYPWMIHFDSSTWDTGHPIFRNINDIYTMTASLKPIELASGIARGYESSFAQFKQDANSWANFSFPNTTLEEFAEAPLSYSAINGTFPSWLSAFEYGAGRVVISGSTLMFTGRNLDYPDTDLRWFYMGDNSRLFMNIIDWLSEDFATAPSAIIPLTILSSVVLVIGVAFYVFKKMR